MKKFFLLIIISVNLFAKGIFNIEEAENILEMKRLNKEKYIEENYSLKNVELLKYDREISSSTLSLLQEKYSYRLAKLEIEYDILKLWEKQKLLNEKIDFYTDYYETILKNKSKFSEIEVEEAKKYLENFQLDWKKENVNMKMKKKEQEVYYPFFIENDFEYKGELNKQKEIIENLAEQEKELKDIKVESITSKKITEFQNKILKCEIDELILGYEFQKESLKLKKESMVIELGEKKNTYDIYSNNWEKKKKELELGLISQKEFFDYDMDRMELRLEIHELELEVKKVDEELKL